MGSSFSRRWGNDECSLEQITLAAVFEKTDHLKPSSFLPEEIWEMVARQLTTKEWVRASGTCKIMCKVQLPSIKLDSSAAQAVVWAAKHLRKAKKFMLTLYGWDQRKSRAIMAAVDPEDWDLRKVHTLGIWMEFSKSFFTRCLNEPRQAAPEAHRWMWIPEILSSALNAKLVILSGDNLAGPALDRCGLPALTRLAHLDLTTPLSPEMCHSIEQLPALRVLSIRKGPGLPDMHALPALDLTCCTSLHEVTLEKILHGKLKYPPGTNFRLDWKERDWNDPYEQLPAMLGDWRKHCRRCISLKINKGHKNGPPWPVSRWPDEMLALPCLILHVLKVMVDLVGTSEQPLVLDLPSLIHFELVSGEAHVFLGAITRPSYIRFHASKHLDLTVENVVAFEAGINTMRYNEGTTLSQNTQQLLKCFDNPRAWHKTHEQWTYTTYHTICRK